MTATPAEPPAVRNCGTCTLCCKLLEVEGLNKPRNRWCNLRRVAMLRNYFGAYEPIDSAIAHLKARGLVTPRTKPLGKAANHRDFLVSRAALAGRTDRCRTAGIFGTNLGCAWCSKWLTAGAARP